MCVCVCSIIYDVLGCTILLNSMFYRDCRLISVRSIDWQLQFRHEWNVCKQVGWVQASNMFKRSQIGWWSLEYNPNASALTRRWKRWEKILTDSINNSCSSFILHVDGINNRSVVVNNAGDVPRLVISFATLLTWQLTVLPAGGRKEFNGSGCTNRVDKQIRKHITRIRAGSSWPLDNGSVGHVSGNPHHGVLV